jgi:hypothetical protein
MKTAYAFEPSARSRAQHVADIRRQCFQHKMKHINDDCGQARDMIRDLIRSGEDVSAEVSELANAAKAFMLLVKILEREAR